MGGRNSRVYLGLGLLAAICLTPLFGAGRTPASPQRGIPAPAGSSANTSDAISASLRVMVTEPNGEPAEMALVTLNMTTGGMLQQATTEVGQVEFDNLAPGEYSVQVISAGYQTVQETVNAISLGTILQVVLRPDPNGAPGASGPPAMPVLAPKVQKLVAKAIEALRTGKTADARQPLEEAFRRAPNHPYVNFLYGIYFSQMNDKLEAEKCWEKAISVFPKYVDPLLYLGDAMVRDNRAADALPYLHRAVEAAPTAWRPHAILAQALLKQQKYDDAAPEAARALELGKAQAVSVQPLQARILAAQGHKEQAITVLQNYLHDRPADSAAQKMLDSLRTPATPAPADAPPAKAKPAEPASAPPPLTSPLVPLAWMPPDVDEKVPPVEPGVPCRLDNVLHRTSLRMQQLISNLDRFTATESLTHDRFNGYGLPAGQESRTFNYLVTMAESLPGYLNVEEYRNGDPAFDDFPDRVVTRGLPSLVLLFHPSQAPNFDFVCEGLTRSAGGLAWLVHFRQNPNKPATMRVYRMADHSYPVALKGRAWIAADSFQVVRLESDLATPIPQIRLAAEHTDIQYGPVRFPNKKVSLWLPQNAEIYFDWRGLRVHRRHSFSNYVLFSVDDKQQILPPKNAGATDDKFEANSDASAAPHPAAPSPPAKQQPVPQP